MTRQRLLVLVGGTAAVLVLVGGYSVTAGDSVSSDGKAVGGEGALLPGSTADVRRGDLTSAVEMQGKLGFAKPQKVNAGGQGVLTWLPQAGASVGRGDRLYELDGQPVFLMHGERPMYRELKEGDKGEDVRQLKENLRALGFGSGLAVDTKFTPGTAKGLKAWQKSKGLKQTGVATPGQIAFTQGTLRVDKPEAGLGDRLMPGTAVLSGTGGGRIVEFEVTPAEAGRLSAGQKAAVRLPDGAEATGRIAMIGGPADTSGDPGGGGKDAKIKVTLEVDRGAGKIKGVDGAPVTVALSGESRTDVLSVPVEALVALPGRGFGVRVVESGKVRDVSVELGLFADGRVEVSGGGLREGMKVGVPA